MTVASLGINYDRLAHLFLSDIEVWRTSTAMPTRRGIFSSTYKDVTIFSALLRAEPKVILALDNRQDAVFTAGWNVSLTALYFNDQDQAPVFTPAPVILPLSARLSAQDKPSLFSLPDDAALAAVPATLPRNAARAVVHVLASGNADEEFWFHAVPSSLTRTFAGRSLHAHAPWREVQVRVDGALVGVAWPFPVVYTGGVNPALWVPVVGIAAYDVPAYQVDVTPWLGLLCDGRDHLFHLTVVGYDEGNKSGMGGINENWLVSGSVFVWLDEGGVQTTGSVRTESPECCSIFIRLTPSAQRL